MTKPLPANPRAAAAHVVTAVMAHRRYLDSALAEALAGAASADQALIQEMAYGTLRWYHRLAGIAPLFLERPLKVKDQDVLALLLVGLYQLRHMRVAAHAAVDETVDAAAALGKPWARNLLNACLRSALRETGRVQAAIEADETLRFSHPRWFIDAVRAAYPDHWEPILAANNERPPLTLRVNRLQSARAEYLAQLRAAGMAAGATPHSDCGVVLEQPVPVSALPGFARGVVSVQDEAAQLAALLLDAQPGERVLDACAAPGGKTGHLLERTPGLDLVAVDREPERIGRLRENLTRLGLSAQLITDDAALPSAWWDGRPFDRILLDAPCSASGVIRRHPDIKLRRRPADVAKLKDTQARLLAGLWPLLQRGGKLLYVTCSILPDENEQQMEAFLARHTDARETPLGLAVGQPAKQGRQILPGSEDMDGFYYASVEKS
jgi:16S rRNA (cytosine967-C5)-methyltransferase